MLKYLPSTIASSAVYLARKNLQRNPWVSSCARRDVALARCPPRGACSSRTWHDSFSSPTLHHTSAESDPLQVHTVHGELAQGMSAGDVHDFVNEVQSSGGEEEVQQPEVRRRRYYDARGHLGKLLIFVCLSILNFAYTITSYHGAHDTMTLPALLLKRRQARTSSIVLASSGTLLFPCSKRRHPTSRSTPVPSLRRHQRASPRQRIRPWERGPGGGAAGARCYLYLLYSTGHAGRSLRRACALGLASQKRLSVRFGRSTVYQAQPQAVVRRTCDRGRGA